MKLTTLGKYGPYPKEGGACSSYLLQHEDMNILIDCGSGSISRLQKFIRLQDIDLILLSHLHFDHISDLFVLRYALEDLKARGVPVRAPLPVYMPGKPADIALMIASAPAFAVQPVEDGEELRAGGLTVKFKSMTHPVPSFAMRFETGGRTFVYSGDTNLNSDIAPFARDADLFLLAAGLLSRDKKDNRAPHLSAVEAGRVAAAANAKAMIATHLYAGYDEREVLVELAIGYKYAKIAEEMETVTI